MRSYTVASPVSAAQIIAITRASSSPSSPYTLICAAPEVGAAAATFEEVTAAWMDANAAAVGGYLVDKGSGDKIYLPAVAFGALCTLAP